MYKMYKTPTFYVFKLFQDHLEKYVLPVAFTSSHSQVDIVASADAALNQIVVTAVNTDLDSACELHLPLLSAYQAVKADIIAPEDVRGVNTFEQPDIIAARPLPLEEMVPASIQLPKHSICRLVWSRE